MIVQCVDCRIATVHGRSGLCPRCARLRRRRELVLGGLLAVFAVSYLVLVLIATGGCPAKTSAPYRWGEIARSGVRARIEPWVQGNQCADAPDRIAQIRAVADALWAQAQRLDIWRGAGVSGIRICGVDRYPWIVCQTVRLAGCVSGERTALDVIFAFRWAPDVEHADRLQPGYSWRATLTHELICALVLADALELPRPLESGSWEDKRAAERRLVESEGYQQLMAATLEAL